MERNYIGPEYNNKKQHNIPMGQNTWKKVQLVEEQEKGQLFLGRLQRYVKYKQ